MIEIDPTGENPEFFVADKRFMVHQPAQIIDLGGIYFEKGFTLYQVENALKIELIEDQDYRITDSDLAEQALGKLLLTYDDFNEVIIKSITILKPSNVRYMVSWAGNVLNKTSISDPITLTDELMDILISQESDIDDIKKSMISNIGGVDPYTSPYMLENDIHGANPDNLITGEVHKVDGTKAYNQLISPAAGPFFGDTLEVIMVATGQPVLPSEYSPISIDLELSGESNYKAPIFKYIFFKNTIVGDVAINYHAVGGRVTVENMRSLDLEFRNLTSFMGGGNIITSNNLNKAPTFLSLIERLVKMEDTVRRLLVQNLADYSDVSDGQSILLQVTSPDADMHWYDIATLYKVSGSDDITEVDQCVLKIGTGQSRMICTTVITTNLHAQKGNQFSLSVHDASVPQKYKDFVDYVSVDDRVIPMFRIVWSKDPSDGIGSGVVLQMGLRLKLFSSEQIAVESMSGVESCWKLLPQPAVAMGPNDDLIQLPDGRVWASGDSVGAMPTCFVEALPLPLPNGILGYGGGIPAATLVGWTIIANIMPPEVDLSKTKKVRIDITDSITSEVSSSTIEFARNQSVLMGSGNITGDTTGRQVLIKIDNSLPPESRVAIRVDVAAEDNIADKFLVNQILFYF